MSSRLPDGWITATLTDAGIPVNDFTVKVMQAWQKSTPILAYTNNPLGMPAVKGQTLELMRTGYAMFVTMPKMREAFASFVNSTTGRAVREALSLGDKYSVAYRAIHALPWPANTTETDWPSAVLDLTSESYRAKAQSVDSPADRRTSGTIGTQTSIGSVLGDMGRFTSTAVNHIQQATTAMRRLPGRGL